MSKPYEVHIRGRRAIACETRAEAEDWASLLGSSIAPAFIHEVLPSTTGTTGPDPRQQTIFDSREGTA